MSKKNNKQGVVQVNSNIGVNVKKRVIIGVVSSISLLVLTLFVVLKVNSMNKSDSKMMVNTFNKYYESDTYKIVCYYDSTIEDNEAIFELDYLTQISKQFGIDYIGVDSSKISEKNQEKIKKPLDKPL